MYFIGIDIGTGSTKALAVEPSGKVLITSQVPYGILEGPPGYSEQNPEVIWDAFKKCVQRITLSLNEKPYAVCLSSAMHSVIPVDRSGAPLGNLITWADNRSSDIATQIRNSSGGQAIYEASGTPIHSMTPLCKVIWIRENQPVLFDSTAKFISIKEFIWCKLFSVFEVDYSIASATGLFNITTLTWNEDSLTRAGIDADRLSVPVNTTFVRTGLTVDVASELNLSSSTPFMIGASDGCLANAGSYAIDPGVAALTIGTSGAIRVAGASPVVNWKDMTFNYRLDDRIFISGGPINNGGIALKWYAQKLLEKTLETQNDYDELLESLAKIPAGSNGLIFLPYILGERAPIWNSDACGVFFGITSKHTQEHFTRSVIEGIVFSLYQIARGIEDNGQPIERIHVSGGFVKSREWIRLLANVFGKKVVLLNTEDASALGAAFLGMKSMHIEGEYSTLPQIDDDEVFDPDEEIHSRYRDKYFPVYEHLYKALALEMKILSDRRDDNIL